VQQELILFACAYLEACSAAPSI